jgi:hypothetical protein
MRVTVSVVDEDGNKYEGKADLSLVSGRETQEEAPARPDRSVEGSIDFTLPLRAFVKTYAAGNSSGAARLVVLLAFLAAGSDGADVPAERVRAEWGRLTAHLGAFNRAHVTRAKDRAWIDSTSSGLYRLGPRWREAFDTQ